MQRNIEVKNGLSIQNDRRELSEESISFSAPKIQ